jgi:diguanylate cyclase (GGDEF)-like protein
VKTDKDVERAALDAGLIASERDRACSERDSSLSEADQRISDRERVIAEREADAPHAPGLRAERDVLRGERAATSAARARNAEIRADTSVRRLQATERCAEDCDRARAVREAEKVALAEAQFDDLTGTYRRTKGTVELQAEIDRAQRFGGRLVLAFVDVDGLKAHNDREGHAAGDKLLLDVVASIRANLRSYDPVMRFGGDEFVCALSDTDLDDARSRFATIRTTLGLAHPGGSISVGLAQLRPDDTLEKLMARGDAALREAKNSR